MPVAYIVMGRRAGPDPSGSQEPWIALLRILHYPSRAAWVSSLCNLAQRARTLTITNNRDVWFP